MACSHTPQCTLQALVGVLYLAVWLGVIAGGEAHHCAEGCTEGPRHPDGEMAVVGDHICKGAMESKHMLDQMVPQVHHDV